MIRALEEILAETKNMVFFGGAGVSTESGIPDFRSVDGLYHQKFKYPPETMLSHFQVLPQAGVVGLALAKGGVQVVGHVFSFNFHGVPSV